MKYKLYFPIIFFLTSIFSCHTNAQKDKESSSTEEVMIIEDENIEEGDNTSSEFKLDTLSFINETTINIVEPKLNKWLSSFHLNIKDFRLIQHVQNKGAFDWDANNDEESIYYRPFDSKEDDLYQPYLYDYSPDKNMYIDVLPSMAVSFEKDTLKYSGGDDSQSIYLTNRKLKKKVQVLWVGSSSSIIDCFWINNNQFVLVSGLDYSYSQNVFQFYLYDLSHNGRKSTYVSKSNVSEDEYLKINYFLNYNLKKRGCPVLND